MLDFQQRKEQLASERDIHAINQVIEKCSEYNKPPYMAFIDDEKAFDLDATTAVLKALRDHRIEETYVTLFKYIYEGFTGMILLQRGSSL